jgi:hypothetical protein
VTWRRRRSIGRELVAAEREMHRAFPPPAEDAPDEQWYVYGIVDEMLAAVASRGRSGVRVASSLAFAAAGRQLGVHESGLDDAQRTAVDRLQAAFAAAERAST